MSYRGCYRLSDPLSITRLITTYTPEGFLRRFYKTDNIFFSLWNTIINLYIYIWTALFWTRWLYAPPPPLLKWCVMNLLYEWQTVPTPIRMQFDSRFSLFSILKYWVISFISLFICRHISTHIYHDSLLKIPYTTLYLVIFILYINILLRNRSTITYKIYKSPRTNNQYF